MKYVSLTIILLALIAGNAAGADQTLDFTLHKLESGHPGCTMLVIGGIQGDEPGGFNAASLLVTRYKINKGNVWVVPNLNFISIIKRSRGVHGDLNRKFASISSNDPEYTAIQKIKSIILDKKVDLVLNLHDGSGFYRPIYEDKLHNPNRWGQCVIIDQEQLEYQRFGNLKSIAGRAVSHVNRHLIEASHAYRVKTPGPATATSKWPRRSPILLSSIISRHSAWKPASPFRHIKGHTTISALSSLL